MTMQQLEKLALMRSKRLNREAWQIMSRLLEQEKLISDIKSKGLRYKTINGNGVVVEKTNDSVVNLQKTTATMLKILADLRLKDPVPEPEKATDGYL